MKRLNTIQNNFMIDFRFIMIIPFFLFFNNVKAQKVVYVNKQVSIAGDGTSWDKAFRHLHEALQESSISIGDSIFVAKGLYKPDDGQDPQNTTPLTEFVIPKGIVLIGGFPSPNMMNPPPKIKDRRINLMEETILEGTPNTKHVLRIVNSDVITELNGFTIKNGNANGIAMGPIEDMTGGGVFIKNSKVRISYCTITENEASKKGGGIAIIDTSEVLITDSNVTSNNSGEEGGGIFIESIGHVTLSRCAISKNSITSNAGEGGGIYHGLYNGNDSSSKLLVVNSAISNNTSIANSTRGLGIINYIKNNSDSSGVFLAQCTIIGNQNSSLSGEGIYNLGEGGISITHSILIHNGRQDLVDVGLGIFSISKGYNILDPGSIPASFPDQRQDIQLMNPERFRSVDQELKNNGGYTLSHAILKEAEAVTINNGDALQLANIISGWQISIPIEHKNELKINVDQRNTERLDEIDIGSYEYQSIEISYPYQSICPGGAKFPLSDIKITDRTGGAILPDPENQDATFEFKLIFQKNPFNISLAFIADAFKFEGNNDSINFTGEGISIVSREITPDYILIKYKRNKEIGEINIIISDLKVFVEDAEQDTLFAAIQLENSFLSPRINTKDSLSRTIFGSVNSRSTRIPLDFSFFNTCLGKKTSFQADTSNLFEGFQYSWEWDFGDDSLIQEGDPFVEHSYNKDTTYHVILTSSIIQGSSKVCETQYSQDVRVFPTIKVSRTAPYIDSFPLPVNNNWFKANNFSSWELGFPQEMGIESMSGNQFDNIWITNKDGDYFNGEDGAIESACFCFSQIQNPIIAMDTWIHSQKQFDGAVVQYYLEKDSSSWITLGSDTTGSNWYNTIGTVTNPGNQATNLYSWSGKDSVWRRSKHGLEELKQYLDNTLIRFRVLFASDFSQPNEFLDGFAFDNVFIGENDRVVLVENFTHADSINADLYDLIDLAQGSFLVQYPIGFENSYLVPDNFYLQNWQDMGPRMLYYGITKPNTVMIDGLDGRRGDRIFDKNKASNRSLADSTVKIDFELNKSRLNFEALVNFENPIAIRFLIVEQGVEYFNNGDSVDYKNLVRALYPNAAGFQYPSGLVKGQMETLDFEINLGRQPIKVDNTDSLLIVAIVQDDSTKKIYQTELIKLTRNLIPILNIQKSDKNEPFFPPTGPAIANIYPSPTSDLINLEIAEDNNGPFHWYIMDIRGKILNQGKVEESGIHPISVNMMASGIYNMLVSNEGQTILVSRFVVQN